MGCPLVVTGDAPGLDQVISELETVIGRPIQRTGDPGILVTVEWPGRSDWRGNTRWDYQTSDPHTQTFAHVKISPDHAGELLVLRHELGHAMGLGHAPSGIMHPTASEWDKAGTWNPQERAWLFSFAARSCD